MDGENISEFLEESEATYSFGSSDDILSILEALDSADSSNQLSSSSSIFEFQKTAAYDSSSSPAFIEISETEVEPPKCKRQKPNSHDHWELELAGGHQKMSHIAVERNRRKQMNHHLSVLRSLMPCFYVKRGDQASIIGGVINYINELQQVMQSLEAKKQRKAYSTTSHEHPPHVLSPRVVAMQMSSPNSLSPRKPPLSPRLPISPRTPSTPMLHNLQTYINSPLSPSPCTSASNSSNDTVNELVATSRSSIADVEVKFCGPNLILKTVSHRIPGQVVKILSALQDLALEILQVNINTLDQRMLNSFTIKIGIECQLSAEELAQQIQRTFS